MFIIIPLLAVIVLGGIYVTFYRFIHPPRFPKKKVPEDLAIDYKDVTFESADGFKLRGWFIEAEKETDKVIIICHGYRANKTHALDWGLFLRQKYNLFYFDFRTHGRSQGRVTSFGYHEVKDVQAAIDYLKRRPDLDPNKIGVMGFSLGGITGLLKVTEGKDIKAIVADSVCANLSSVIKVYHDYHWLKWAVINMGKFCFHRFLKFNTEDISLEKKAELIKTPTLLIHAKDDPIIPSQNSQLLYEKLLGPKEIWLSDSAEHGKTYYLFKKEYEKKVLKFFNEYL